MHVNLLAPESVPALQIRRHGERKLFSFATPVVFVLLHNLHHSRSHLLQIVRTRCIDRHIAEFLKPTRGAFIDDEGLFRHVHPLRLSIHNAASEAIPFCIHLRGSLL